MKKLLGISLVAALAVSPMMAMAEVTAANTSSPTHENGTAIKADAAPSYALVDETPTAAVASTSYVKGAYNAAMKAVNKVADQASTAAGNIDLVQSSSSAGGVTFTDAAGTTHEVVIRDIEAGNIADEAVETEAIKAGAVTTAKIADEAVTFGKIEADDIVNSTEAIQSTTNASDSKLVTERAVAAAIENINTDLSDNFATKEGVVSTINKSGTVVYTTWNSDATDVAAGSVRAPDNYTYNKYYPTYTGSTAETMSPAQGTTVAPGTPTQPVAPANNG